MIKKKWLIEVTDFEDNSVYVDEFGGESPLIRELHLLEQNPKLEKREGAEQICGKEKAGQLFLKLRFIHLGMLKKLGEFLERERDMTLLIPTGAVSVLIVG